MSATVLLWKSHRGGFFNFGHASLALSYDDELTKTRLATITWYPHPGAKQQFGGHQNSTPQASATSGTPLHWRPDGIHSELHNFAVKPTQEIRTLRNLPDRTQEQTERLNNLKQWYPRMRQFQNVAGSEWLGSFLNAAEEKGFQFAEKVLNTRICPPTETVTIPTLNDPDTIIGLNDVAMYEWWETFSSQKKRYHLLKRNCSSSVGGALIAGGAHVFVEPPKVGSWTPTNVTNWAKDVRKEVLKLQTKFNVAKQELVAKRAKADGSAANKDVWSVYEFKQNSKGKSRFASRYEELKNVDKALQFYHEVTFRNEPAAVKRNLELLALAGVVIRLDKVIHKNRGSGSVWSSGPQRESHRLKGLITLGLQVLKRIDRIKQQQTRGEQLKQEYSRLIAQLNADLHTNLRNLRSVDLAISLSLTEEHEKRMAVNVRDVLKKIEQELGKEPEFVAPPHNMVVQDRDWHAPDPLPQFRFDNPFQMRHDSLDDPLPQGQFDNPFQLRHDSLDDSEAEWTPSPPPPPLHHQQIMQPWQVPQRLIHAPNVPVTMEDFLNVVDDGKE